VPRSTYARARTFPAGCIKKREREKFKTVRRAGKPANFPNFANKLSDVKIPRWIVKVLTSSATSQFSCLLPAPYVCTSSVQQSQSSRKRGRDAKRTARGGDEDQRGLRWCKSTPVLYLPGLDATLRVEGERGDARRAAAR